MKIIYQNKEGGVCIVVPTGEISLEEVIAKDLPEGVTYEIVEDDAIPTDRTFRNAWVLGDCCIEHDLDKCKALGHDMRRAKRAEEFKPYDNIIALQIPGADAVKAEEARQEIRDRYAAVQDAIDGAVTPEDIKAALEVTP